jgi:hypothetical protein
MLRHDWNSLIGVPVEPFTNWTEEYFPDADVLVSYLKAASEDLLPHLLREPATLQLF